MRRNWKNADRKDVQWDEITLRELMELTPDTAGEKAPSAKRLWEMKDEVLFEVAAEQLQLSVYANGWFAYRIGRFVTVQSIHRCKAKLEYRYQDGTVSEVSSASFMESPCAVRLVLEGEQRLVHNQLTRDRQNHVFSYDNMALESVDLSDEYDAAEEFVNREERDRIHRSVQTASEQLTEKQRRTIDLYFYEARTQQEIADILGCKKQTVSESIRSALQRMKRSMEKA